ARSRVALQAVASVDGRADAGAAWDEVAARCRYRAGARFEAASEFVFESPFVPALAALRDYGAPSFVPGRPLPQAAHELMQRIRDDFTYDGNATEVHTPLAQVFEARRGVCQDFA
ncbi:MAG: transglutaminase-like domain-containing protein, partial [Betaproteobacteria bacterium]